MIGLLKRKLNAFKNSLVEFISDNFIYVLFTIFICLFMSSIIYSIQYNEHYTKELISKAGSMDISQCKNDPEGFLKREKIASIINDTDSSVVESLYTKIINDCRHMYVDNKQG